MEPKRLAIASLCLNVAPKVVKNVAEVVDVTMDAEYTPAKK